MGDARGRPRIQSRNLLNEEWQDSAACQTSPNFIFFTEDSAEAIRKAKSICNKCQVIDQCLDYALTNREKHGVWGGLTTAERDKAKRRRAREKKRISD